MALDPMTQRSARLLWEGYKAAVLIFVWSIWLLIVAWRMKEEEESHQAATGQAIHRRTRHDQQGKESP